MTFAEKKGQITSGIFPLKDQLAELHAVKMAWNLDDWYSVGLSDFYRFMYRGDMSLDDIDSLIDHTVALIAAA